MVTRQEGKSPWRSTGIRGSGALFAVIAAAMWVIVPVVVLALGVWARDAGATKGQSLIASYLALLVLVAVIVKLLSLLDLSYRARSAQTNSGTADRSPAELVVVALALLVVVGILVWFLFGDTCDTGLYVCG